MKIIITGGTGFIGINLIKSLFEEKHKIIALIRNPKKLEPVAGCIDQIIRADLEDAYSLRGKLVKADICIHLAGLTKSADIDAFFNSNYHGTVNLIREIKKTMELKHFIYLSSLAASSPDGSLKGIGEYKPARPVSSYGQSKLVSELYVKRSGLNYTILRPPIVYGPYDKDILTFFKAVKTGLVPVFHREKRYSMVYVQDLISMITKIINNKKTFKKIYNTCNNKSYTMVELINSISRALNKKPYIIRIPEGFLYLTAPLYEFFANKLRLSPILTQDKLLEIIQEGWVSDPSLICEDLKMDADTGYSLAEGTKQTAEWYKENGWL